MWSPSSSTGRMEAACGIGPQACAPQAWTDRKNMSLLPLDWVVVDAPSNRTEHQINGSFGRVMWVAGGEAVLRLAAECEVPGGSQ